MEIERGLESFFVEVVEEEFRRGEENAVPSVAGPAEIVARLVFLALGHKLLLVDVPVHVDDQYVERHTVLVKAGDNVVEFLVAVGPIARPPSPEGEARRQRDPSRNPNIVAECLFVVVAVAEEVPVLPLAGGARHDPWPGAVCAF